jgi:ClpP class serine protease
MEKKKKEPIKKVKSETNELNIPPEVTTTNITPDPLIPKLTMSNLFEALITAYGEKGTDQQKKDCDTLISKYLNQISDEFPCSANYNILILYDEGSIVKSDADRIYNAVTKFSDDKPILLMLYSKGGLPGSAYLIGKLCREYTRESFIITVPRMAKSSATLICCGANEIHMGSLSELGPIDPQINEYPALGLKYSIEHIAELVKRYPAASDMFAKYLHLSLELINLGYYERVAESAMQYAEKLLLTHAENLPKLAKDIAEDLVYKYKDHGFVIDKAEAELIFGEQIIKKNTEVYELGNSLYKVLDLISSVVNFSNFNFYFIGSLESSGVFTKRKQK